MAKRVFRNEEIHDILYKTSRTFKCIRGLKKMMKKFSSGMLGVVAVIALIIGGFVTLNLVKKHEMVTLVQSTQVRESIENQLKDLDKKALEEGGVIQSYEIDVESIQHNPMGGIRFKIYLNSDKKLSVSFSLTKNMNTGQFEHSSTGYSKEVSDLIKNKQ